MSDPLPTDSIASAKADAPYRNALKRYWNGNLKLMGALLAVWAIAGLGCGVLFADYLNEYTLPGTGYPLGFWFAQQGSIIVFVILILVFCLLMNGRDEKHHRELEKINSRDGEGI